VSRQPLRGKNAGLDQPFDERPANLVSVRGRARDSNFGCTIGILGQEVRTQHRRAGDRSRARNTLAEMIFASATGTQMTIYESDRKRRA
jgi:hypothetical protein